MFILYQIVRITKKITNIYIVRHPKYSFCVATKETAATKNKKNANGALQSTVRDNQHFSIRSEMNRIPQIVRITKKITNIYIVRHPKYSFCVATKETAATKNKKNANGALQSTVRDSQHFSIRSEMSRIPLKTIIRGEWPEVFVVAFMCFKFFD